ncbi:allantoin permease [Bacillus sp. JJ1532]|uniref:purine-cytosine permease family protein n=1 Tax=Bacillus sp. JJ1532 TaxID=3122958 RepID=UPI002FFFB1BF
MRWFEGPTNTSKAENIEDYAIRKIPSHYRWPIPAIIMVLIGNSTALYFYMFGVNLAYTVGWPWMLLPILYFFLGSSLIGMVMINLASKEGLTIDLMTRGMGFGYLGSAVTSLIYGINFVFYFIFEGTIVTHAIAIFFGIHFSSLEGTIIFAIIGLIKLFLVWFGMKELQFLQSRAILIYGILFGFAIYILVTNFEAVGPIGWTALKPVTSEALWTAFMLVNGQVVFQGLMATDYGRFAKKSAGYKGGFLCMIGMLIPMILNMIAGPLFAFTLLKTFNTEGSTSLAANPGYVFPILMGGWGVLFVIVTQIRINVMNLYSCSLALSNSFSLFFNFRPGRQWWMVFVFLFSCVIYAFDILQFFDTWLAVSGILTNTWIFILLADHYICKKLLKFGPSDFIEYRRPFLFKWNPTGLFSLLFAVGIGALGIFNFYPIYYASFISMIIGPILHVLLTIKSKGRFYFTHFPVDRDTNWMPDANKKVEIILNSNDNISKDI